MDKLNAREIRQEDLELIADYWLLSSHDYMKGMGVDVSKIPPRQEWIAMLQKMLFGKPDERQSYCVIWEINGVPSGHNNINKIVPEESAYMHLHLWKRDYRKNGLGEKLLKKSIPMFFDAII